MTPEEQLRTIVERVTPQLDAMDAEAARRRPAEGKWSPKEVIGHLIDSATNNHARFVRAQGRSDLVFEGYEQEHWVRAQQYRDEPWDVLVRLWSAYNLHLAWVMGRIPADDLTRPCTLHSFDTIAWRTVKKETPATLGYLLVDYIGHLENHLRQIFADYEPLSKRQAADEPVP